MLDVGIVLFLYLVTCFSCHQSANLAFVEDLKGVNITFRVAMKTLEGVAVDEYCLPGS